jgi:hypothetical protein
LERRGDPLAPSPALVGFSAHQRRGHGLDHRPQQIRLTRPDLLGEPGCVVNGVFSFNPKNDLLGAVGVTASRIPKRSPWSCPKGLTGIPSGRGPADATAGYAPCTTCRSCSVRPCILLCGSAVLIILIRAVVPVSSCPVRIKAGRAEDEAPPKIAVLRHVLVRRGPPRAGGCLAFV